MARAGTGARGGEVEGIHAVAAALAAGRVESLLFERRAVGSLAGLIDEADRRGVPYGMVDDLRDRAATTAPQGVIARCRPLPSRSLDDAIAAVTPAAILVLDHVVDPRNIGAIARSAVAAGIGGLVLSQHRAAPLSAAAFKAAAGALEHIAVVEVSSVAGAVDQLRRRDVWTVGLDAAGDRSLFGLDLLAAPVAVVLGAEGEGLGRLVGERVDVLASIPILGPVESLNVSVAGAIAAYEIARVRST
jgi:23S rRNA (guanosine2251-2'-O)-methyltransferase